MRLFLREGMAEEGRRAALYLQLTNLSVWGEANDLNKQIAEFNKRPT